MAACKSCGTRVRDGDRHCPNCGRNTNPGSSLTGMKPLPDPGDSGVQTRPPEPKAAPASEPEPAPEAPVTVAPEPAPEPVTEPIAPAPAEPEPEPAIEPEAPLPDVASEPLPEVAPEPPPAVKSQPATQAKEKPVSNTKTADREVELSEPAHEAPGTLGNGIGAEAMRVRLVDDPELIEPGLAVYRDPKTGAPAGAEYSTDVGTIDLLAEGSDGALVVVMVAEAGGDPVAPVLEQLGWVAKHMAGEDRAVRAIVLLEPPAPELGYAARAVAETVAFKTWRVAIAVDDVEL